jgi:uncharacterized metal-binding protein YceD (DUF177 family)
MTSSQGAADPATAAPEFSRPFPADSAQGRGRAIHVAAKADELTALARRFGLVELTSLEADLTLSKVRGGQMVRVKGELRAQVVQSCVVTLEPVAAEVKDSFQALFAPPAAIDPDAEELDVSLSDEDGPEPLEGGRIDLGELVAQHLSLALDPYPRKPDAAFTAIAEGPEVPEPAKVSPFAVLKGRPPG